MRPRDVEAGDEISGWAVSTGKRAVYVDPLDEAHRVLDRLEAGIDELLERWDEMPPSTLPATESRRGG